MSGNASPLAERMRENHRRLIEALAGEDETSRTGSVARELADLAADGVLRWHTQTERVEVQTERRDIDWSGASYRTSGDDASLNNFRLVAPLAEAYRQTGEDKYAAAARDYIADWIRAHPTCDDWQPVAYDSTLTIPCRVDFWCMAMVACGDAEGFADAFIEEVIASVAAQFDFLMRHIGGGNWGISQGDTLLRTGMLLAGCHPEADTWRDKGVRVVNDLFHRNILPDGAHAERTPDYHVWMTRLFRKCLKLGRAMPELGLCVDAGSIARMYNYAVAMLRPDLCQTPIGDAHAHPLPEDLFALRREFLEQEGVEAGNPPLAQFFPDAGQACLRDSWEAGATYVTFDATVWGGPHCHVSRNAVQLFAHGQPLVIDPGRLSYEPDAPIMLYSRSTRAHSTVNLNGWNQIFANPLTRFRSAAGYDVIDSLYDAGYWSGAYGWYFGQGFGTGRWAEHHRTMVWIRGRCVVVLDGIACSATEPSDFLESNWTLSEGQAAILPGNNAAATEREDANVLLLFPLTPENAKLAIHQGEEDPLRGWALKAWAPHEYIPAPQVSLRIDDLGCEPALVNLATVLIPYSGAERPQVTAEANELTEDGRGVGRLVLRWGDGTVDEIWWRRRLDGALYTCDGFETDASLVHFLRDEDGRLVRGLVVDGTHILPYAPAIRPRPETFVI